MTVEGRSAAGSSLACDRHNGTVDDKGEDVDGVGWTRWLTSRTLHIWICLDCLCKQSPQVRRVETGVFAVFSPTTVGRVGRGGWKRVPISDTNECLMRTRSDSNRRPFRFIIQWGGDGGGDTSRISWMHNLWWRAWTGASRGWSCQNWNGTI